MIIRSEADVTEAVIAELARAPDARFREILGVAVRHLHAFVREARLTEAEFQQACACIARLGQATNASHNEVVLAAGSLGLSSLVCLLNNAGRDDGQQTTANLLGPFWRQGSPELANGDSLLRSSTSGEALLVDAWINDRRGQPVAGALVDVWHASTEGFYENQDPTQADMNMRGTFSSDEAGHVWFRTVKPAGYPIPVAGPVGDLLRAQGRHNMRPAHIHFLIRKPGFKTQFSQVYSSDDPYLETDVQFGVTAALIGQYERHEDGALGAGMQSPWFSLEHRFVLDAGESTLPRAPITGRASDARPTLVKLSRS